EIKILFSVKEISNYIIDTTRLKATELEEKIREQIKIDEKKLNVHIQSFGFKYGIPLDSDLIFDVRFMPNPYYIPELKEKNGYDKEIIDYVMKNHENLEFCEYLKNMLLFLIPKYIKEGKKHLTISIGCSGGKHRSVAVANNLSEDLKHLDYLNSYINHREKNVGHW
ncbi:MAG: RNase adapter RapZ, partial [Fusobacterium sp.]|nr:RNase adapter RapZ [Fusobacterium sp.]